MLFHFRLRPVHDIVPWGPEPHLHWFGLTDGWCWLDVGGVELFRYDQALVETYRYDAWAASTPPDLLPYVDYQVARLWEDILDILPDVLDPIPPKLAQLLGSGGAWTEWVKHAEALATGDELWQCLDTATEWWWHRRLDSAYLVSGPSIWFWSDGNNIYIQWDNRNCMLQGHQAWGARLGQISIPKETFLDEVRSFNARFLEAMARRVADLRTGWMLPDVAIEVDQLVASQEDRAQWLDRRLDAASKRKPTDWSVVYSAVDRVEKTPGFDPVLVIRLAQ